MPLKRTFMRLQSIFIDDRPNNGARDFIGEFISFNPLEPNCGDSRFPNWEKLMVYMRGQAE